MSTTPSAPQPPAAGAPPAKSSGLKIFLWIVGIFAGLILIVVLAFVGLGFFVYHKAKEAGFDTELMKKNPALAAAKMAVTANADTEIVSSNDDAGTIVVRDKKTGKVVTMKFDPEKKSMVITDENGKTTSMQINTDKNSLTVTDDKGKTATITADGQAGNVQINGPDGNVKIGSTADKPPDWVPVYPGASPQGTFSASSAGEQTASYTFLNKDGVDKVLSYYESQLKSSGMKTSNTITTSNGKKAGITTGTSSDDKRTVVVSAQDEDQGTRVSVTYHSKP